MPREPHDQGAQTNTRPELQEGPMLTRAMFSPNTLNEEARTAEVVFATQNPVSRMAYQNYNYERVSEILVCAPGAVRMDRLNNKAPVLDNHNRYEGTKGVVGVVESARLENGQGIALIRFSKSEAGERVFQDVKDGILSGISAGYTVHEYNVTTRADGPDEYRATDWEPTEISLAPIPADYKSMIRTRDQGVIINMNTAPIGQNAANAANAEDAAKTTRTMDVKDQVGANTPPAVTPPAQVPTLDVEQVRSQAVAAERTRANEIQAAARIAGLDAEFVRNHVEAGTSIEAVRAAVLTEMAARQVQITNHQAASVQGDETEQIRSHTQAGILMRAGQQVREDQRATGRPYANMRLAEVARECLHRQGENTRGLSEMEIVGRSISSSTSDFPVILGGVIHQVLLNNYVATPDTWRRFCATGSVSDFRPHHRIRLDALSNLDDVNENGEFKNKSIPDGSKESIIAKTKGNIINVSRQMIVNDDMGAFLRLAAMLGRAAMRTIEARVYALLAENSGFGPTMGDGNPLFYAAHANIGTGSALTVAGLDADRIVMAQQTDGQDYLDLRPSALLVPITLGGTARVLNTSTWNPDVANKLNLPNIVNALFTDIIDTPRLSGTKRYLFANPAEEPVIEVAFLNGQESPFMETHMPFNVDGMSWKIRLDFGVGGIGWKGAVLNAGA